MATLIPAVTRHEVARSIYRDIISGRDNFFVFAGKSFDTPGLPADTRNFLADVHKNILLLKKIVPGPNDVVYMIRRIDWTAGTEYVEYEDDVNLDGQDFYVMTDEYKIYKCLNNNNGAPSIEKPTSTDPAASATVKLNDNYIWKFMYQVPVLDRIKFLTSEYIPVRNVSDGVNFDVNGVIDSVHINNAGSGYITPYLVIQGDGSSPKSIIFNASSSVDVTNSYINFIGHTFETGDQVLYNAGGGIEPSGLSNNFVYYVIKIDANNLRLATSLANAELGTYVSITSIGSGSAHKLSSTGTTATVATNSAGAITNINITNSLRGYTHARALMYDAHTTPADNSLNYLGTITTSQNDETVIGTGTKFKRQLIAGRTLVDLDGDILGVIANDSVTISKNIIFDGTTAVSVINNTITYNNHPFEDDDQVIYNSNGGTEIPGLINGETYYVHKVDNDNIKLATSFSNLDSNIYVSLTAPGIGPIHKLTAKSGSLSSQTHLELESFPPKIITNQSYTAFSGGGFEGTVILEAETANPINQEVVNQTIHGAIYKVDIDNPGAGYTVATVSVHGDGEGAQFKIDPSQIVGGQIQGVTIPSPGQNYNYIRLEVNGINTTKAILTAHVGPQGGHGANIAKELYARTICISTVLDTDNPDLFQGNDYRQVGIIKNPKLYNDIQDVDVGYFNSVTGTSSFIITVPSSQYEKYNIDNEIQTTDGGTYKVVAKLYDEKDRGYKVYLLYLEGDETFTNASLLSNITTGDSDLSCSKVQEPEFDKNTGTIIYVNNVSPVTRNYEQAETIKLFLNF